MAAATATSTTRRRRTANETGPDTDDATVPVTQAAALNIVKDATVPGGTADAAGEMISYTITVANTGNTTLTGVVVTDPNANAGSICAAPTRWVTTTRLLEVGEIWAYTASAHRDAGRDRQQWRRRRQHRQHGDGRQRPDRSGYRRCNGAGGADARR